MAGTPHRIRTQRWVVTTATKDNAFAMREYLRREWESALLPAMERAFDEADAPHRTNRFSRLEITVRVREDDLADDLPMLIYRELAVQLRDMISPGNGMAAGAGLGAESTISEDRFETLLHYLRTGSLLWAASFTVDHDPVVVLRETCALEMKRLVALLLAGAAHAGDIAPFLFRLLQLLSEENMRAFVQMMLEGDPEVSSAGAVRAAELISGAGGGSRSFHERLHAGSVFLAASLRGVDVADDPHLAAAREESHSRKKPSSPVESQGDVLVSLFRLLRHVIAGNAVLSATAIPTELPQTWRERLVDVIAKAGVADTRAGDAGVGSTGAGDAGSTSIASTNHAAGMAGRDNRLNHVAVLLAECLRDAGARVQGSARAVEAFVLLLDDMASGELSRFIQSLMEHLPQAWKSDAIRLVESVIQGRDISLPRNGRLRLAAALLIESQRNVASAVAPDLGVVREVLSAEEWTALVTIRALHDSSTLLPMNRDYSGTGRSVRKDSAERSETESGMQDSGRGDRQDRGDKPDLHRIAVESTMPDDALPITVHHAGLILLHPFIASFLGNTGVVDARSRELPESALPRAAALLHMLATGNKDVHEFELGLCKLLLGQEVDAPLPVASGLIQPEDIEEAESLLASVIEHWGILQGTSIEGFRFSFLQRRGLLRRDDMGWRLQVEPAPFDMLLDQLPWGISIVRLPWMQKPIQVEWERV